MFMQTNYDGLVWLWSALSCRRARPRTSSSSETAKSCDSEHLSPSLTGQSQPKVSVSLCVAKLCICIFIQCISWNLPRALQKAFFIQLLFLSNSTTSLIPSQLSGLNQLRGAVTQIYISQSSLEILFVIDHALSSPVSGRFCTYHRNCRRPTKRCY